MSQSSTAALLGHLDMFHEAMIQHIEFYTIGQYKDWPEDEATFYSASDCVWQIRKYHRRFGHNVRPGQDAIDMLKTAHYAALCAAKIYGGDLLDLKNPPETGMKFRTWEWCQVYGWLCQAIGNSEVILPIEVISGTKTAHPMVERIGSVLKLIDRTFIGPDIINMLDIVFYAALAWLYLPAEKAASGDPAATLPVHVKALHPEAVLPEFKTTGSVGADLVSVENHEIPAGHVTMIGTGLAVEIPEGWEGQVRARSGISYVKQLVLPHGLGTIDADYRGEILVPLKNLSGRSQSIAAGDRIAQLMIRPAPKCEFRWAKELSDTARGAGGFGSTGVQS